MFYNHIIIISIISILNTSQNKSILFSYPLSSSLSQTFLQLSFPFILILENIAIVYVFILLTFIYIYNKQYMMLEITIILYNLHIFLSINQIEQVSLTLILFFGSNLLLITNQKNLSYFIFLLALYLQ